MPKCDMHPDREAKYDFRTNMGSWMNGCEVCFATHAMYQELGTGKGQRLVLADG